MKELKPGDSISGLSVSGFSTVYDLIFDNMLFIGAICLFGLMTLLGLFVLITEIPVIDRFLAAKTFMGHPSKGNGMKILAVTLAVFIYFSARFLINLVAKLIPFFKTKTAANIIDSSSYVTFRKYEDSTYKFTLSFTDGNGEEIKAIKHVTSNTSTIQSGTIYLSLTGIQTLMTSLSTVSLPGTSSRFFCTENCLFMWL